MRKENVYITSHLLKMLVGNIKKDDSSFQRNLPFLSPCIMKASFSAAVLLFAIMATACKF